MSLWLVGGFLLPPEKQDQKIAAFGSSYTDIVYASRSCRRLRSFDLPYLEKSTAKKNGKA
jgi:hypothetical protein